jgi:XTP/dITP diphosphohydrolase
VSPLHLLLATANAHKVAEIAAILGPDVELEAYDPGIDETGTTFEANALLKGRAVVAATGISTLADDSGIVIDGLGGRPGVHSARWTDEGDWIPRVLRELAAEPALCRAGRYVCAAVACLADGREFAEIGIVEGTIADAPRGHSGFGYDPLFVPSEGDGRTFAEMSAAEKHALSHRGRAFRALAGRLAT